MKLLPSTLIVVATLATATQVSAGTLTLRLGPPSVGQGGANPLGIPPGSTDMEFAWITESQWETSFSVSPGFLIGKRHKWEGLYVGIGGGLIISSNGVGLGPYSSFGWESSGSFLRYGIEYKQALGFASSGLVSPYALRAGLGIVL
jgi:hypothetical protein